MGAAWSSFSEQTSNNFKWAYKNGIYLIAAIVIIIIIIIVAWIIQLRNAAMKNVQTEPAETEPAEIPGGFETPEPEPEPEPEPTATESVVTEPPVTELPSTEKFITFLNNESLSKFDTLKMEEEWNLNMGSKALGYSVSNDDEYALVGCQNNTAKYIKISTLGGRIINTLSGHTGPVNCTSISSNGQRAVTGSDDNTSINWDLSSGREINRFGMLTNPIDKIEFINQGRNIIAISGGNVYLWSTNSEYDYLEYPINDNFGPAKYISPMANDFTKFIVGTDTHILLYEINANGFMDSNKIELGSYTNTFYGSLAGMAVNPTLYDSKKEVVLFDSSGRIYIIDISIDDDYETKDTFTLIEQTEDGKFSTLGSKAQKDGISYSMNGELITAGGVIWKRSDGSRLGFTCTNSDCTNTLSIDPIFFKSY